MSKQTKDNPTKGPVEIQGKAVYAVQRVDSEDGKHYHINAFDEKDGLVDTYTFTSEDTADQQAITLGATKDGKTVDFDENGWWRYKS